MIDFFNREHELEVLHDLVKRSGFRTLLLYGRRRIGKTFLLKKLLSDTGGIYLLSLKRSMGENVSNFSRIIASHNLPYVAANTYIDLFTNLAPYLENKILVIDEFQYLFEKNSEVLSDFQYIFDELLAKISIFVILCGSSLGMVESVGTSTTSPLYGRFTARMKLKRFSFSASKMIHPSLSFTDQILNFGALGGIPQYHLYFNDDKTFRENVKKTFFNSSHPLYSDTEFLLRQELKEISVYSGILHAIANGKTRSTEIANSIYIPTKDVSRYINTLISLGIIERLRPINSSPKSKLTRYRIIDNYFRFWYHFVSTVQTQIEFQNLDEAMYNLNNSISSYMGIVVEDIILEAFQSDFPRLGKWWYRDNEIDLIAVNDNQKQVVFVEIKWTQKRRKKKEILKLMNKSVLVRGFEEYSKQYILISLNGFTGSYSNGNCEFWSAEDLARKFNI